MSRSRRPVVVGFRVTCLLLGIGVGLSCGPREQRIESTVIVQPPAVVVTTAQPGQAPPPQTIVPESDPAAEPACVDPLPGEQPTPFSPVVDIAVNEDRSCSVHADGRLCCWGRRLSSLWDGSREKGARTRPIRIQGVTSVKQAALGVEHSCAREEDGTVLCWGRGRFGQLGNGSEEAQGEPSLVPGLHGITDLAAGENHSCAAREDGSVRCWGEDVYGACSAEPRRHGRMQTVPRGVDGLRDVDRLVLGKASCAILRDRTFRCWATDLMFVYAAGDEDGQGFSTLNKVRGVVDLGLGSRGASDQDACAVLENGQIWCWGRNLGERVGQSRGGQKRMRAKRFGDIADAEQIVAGTRHFCVRRRDGTVWCWGENGDGQLGDGTTVDRNRPVKAVDLENVVDLSAGPRHSCAVRSNGKVLCWGENDWGQLGDGTKVDRPVPAEVVW